MTNRIRSITLLAVFFIALCAESSFAFSAKPIFQPTAAACHRRNVSYSSNNDARRRRSGSKLRTALRIAAPAALGAGIGVLAGGKKGAAAGALLGGGGGALYHLFQSRRR